MRHQVVAGRSRKQVRRKAPGCCKTDLQCLLRPDIAMQSTCRTALGSLVQQKDLGSRERQTAAAVARTIRPELLHEQGTRRQSNDYNLPVILRPRLPRRSSRCSWMTDTSGGLGKGWSAPLVSHRGTLSLPSVRQEQRLPGLQGLLGAEKKGAQSVKAMITSARRPQGTKAHNAPIHGSRWRSRVA